VNLLKCGEDAKAVSRQRERSDHFSRRSESNTGSSFFFRKLYLPPSDVPERKMMRSFDLNAYDYRAFPPFDAREIDQK